MVKGCRVRGGGEDLLWQNYNRGRYGNRTDVKLRDTGLGDKPSVVYSGLQILGRIKYCLPLMVSLSLFLFTYLVLHVRLLYI